MCIRCTCACVHVTNTCTIARLHATKHRQCIRSKIKKVLPMLSHFLSFKCFGLFARIVDRNVRDITVCFSYEKRYKWVFLMCTATVDIRIWSVYCHQPEIKIISLWWSWWCIFLLFIVKYYHLFIYLSWFVIQST